MTLFECFRNIEIGTGQSTCLSKNEWTNMHKKKIKPLHQPLFYSKQKPVKCFAKVELNKIEK